MYRIGRKIALRFWIYEFDATRARYEYRITIKDFRAFPMSSFRHLSGCIYRFASAFHIISRIRFSAARTLVMYQSALIIVLSFFLAIAPHFSSIHPNEWISIFKRGHRVAYLECKRTGRASFFSFRRERTMPMKNARRFHQSSSALPLEGAIDETKIGLAHE